MSVINPHKGEQRRLISCVVTTTIALSLGGGALMTGCATAVVDEEGSGATEEYLDRPGMIFVPPAPPQNPSGLPPSPNDPPSNPQVPTDMGMTSPGDMRPPVDIEQGVMDRGVPMMMDMSPSMPPPAPPPQPRPTTCQSDFDCSVSLCQCGSGETLGFSPCVSGQCLYAPQACLDAEVCAGRGGLSSSSVLPFFRGNQCGAPDQCPQITCECQDQNSAFIQVCLFERCVQDLEGCRAADELLSFTQDAFEVCQNRGGSVGAR